MVVKDRQDYINKSSNIIASASLQAYTQGPY